VDTEHTRRRIVALVLALAVFVILLPVVPATECRNYGDDVEGCMILARSIVQIRVSDGPLGVVVATVAGSATGLLALVLGRRRRVGARKRH
jgi:hypothetical protein